MNSQAIGAVQSAPQFSGAHQAKSVLHEWFETRTPFRQKFLDECGLQEACLTPMREDMGARRYFRVSLGSETRVLMESVPDGHAYATPGQRLDDYKMIADLLRQYGIATPRIFAYDFTTGYMLIEDFGDLSFRSALISGAISKSDLYGSAMDVLKTLARVNWPTDIPRETYYDGAMYKGLRRLVDWYVPMQRGMANDLNMVDQFLSCWNQVEEQARIQVGEPVQGLVHCDFHLENLQWRSDQTGLARAGVLDFQDARPGPAVYDLTNLLNDARMSLDPETKRIYLDQFLKDVPLEKRANYERWFWIYSAQFLHRVAGQFIKHATIGNTRYMQFMPFIQENLKDIMAHDFLSPVQDFLTDLGVNLNPFPDNFNFAAHQKLIASDAY